MSIELVHDIVEKGINCNVLEQGEDLVFETEIEGEEQIEASSSQELWDKLSAGAKRYLIASIAARDFGTLDEKKEWVLESFKVLGLDGPTPEEKNNVVVG